VTEAAIPAPAPKKRASWRTSLVAGLVAGLGLIGSVFATATARGHEQPSGPMTASSPAPAAPPVQPGPWATTGQLEQLKTELTAEIRAGRNDVAGALRQLEQATARLHDVEIQQAEQRGEQRARTAGYRR
jgi:hypothetical protein